MSRELSRQLAEIVIPKFCGNHGTTGNSTQGYSCKKCGMSIHESRGGLYDQRHSVPDFLSPTVFWPEFLGWCAKVGASYRLDIEVMENEQFTILYRGVHKSAYEHTDLGKMMEAACVAWLAALTAKEVE